MGYDFLHEENRDLWHQWFLKAGVSARPERGLVYTDGGMVLQAALRGQGVALVDTLFARDDIAAGRLIQPFDITLPYGAYWMVARSFFALPSPAKDFSDWLMNALSPGTAFLSDRLERQDNNGAAVNPAVDGHCSKNRTSRADQQRLSNTANTLSYLMT